MLHPPRPASCARAPQPRTSFRQRIRPSGGGGACLAAAARTRRRGPQLLQVVVLADSRLHDMNHDLPEVDQYPFARALAFDPVDAAAERLHLLLDVTGQGPALARGVRARDDDPVEQRRDTPDI